MNYSLTYIGVLVFAVGYLFKMAGVPFIEGDLENTISFITAFVGVITSIYGRWRKGDLNIFGTRKV